jgi:tetratricopeptide (TPR) repeat protein
MRLNKFHVNLIFAFVVLVLSVIAVGSLIKMRSSHSVAPESSSSLPKDHPPVDMSKELAELEQLSAKDPGNANYRTQIGNIFYDMGQYDKAVVYYTQSLELRPRDPNVETDLAVCYHYLGHDDKSLEILEKILQYSPDFAQAMFNKGIVLISGKKDIQGGIAVWEKLLRIHPDFPRRAEIQQSIDQLKASLK